MYIVARSGINKIKTILSRFVIPLFLISSSIVKAIYATFAVVTGMHLGKEGSFVQYKHVLDT